MRETPFRRMYQRLLGGDPEADVQDELETHISSRVEDLMRQGRTESEARAQAQREFGDMARIRREMRTRLNLRCFRSHLHGKSRCQR